MGSEPVQLSSALHVILGAMALGSVKGEGDRQ